MPPLRDRLTVKERVVATQVSEGLTNRDIAGRIPTREQVVKNHLRSAFDELGVGSRRCMGPATAGRSGSRRRHCNSKGRDEGMRIQLGSFDLGGCRRSGADWI